MKPNLLDRAIGWVAPGAAAKRLRNRAAMEILARGYDGADRGRLNSGWRTAGTSADAEIAAAGALLRDRMRDLVRNNPHAANATSILVTHLVGTGIMPRANTGDPAKDAKINRLFDRHSKRCDADGQHDYFGVQALAVRGMIESGDGLVRRRWRRREDGLPVPVQYQVVETDLIDSTKEGATAPGRTAIQGIEFDALGRRSAYWLFPTHPGNRYIGAELSLTSKAVPAEDVAHVYRKDRTQVRGAPWGAPVIRSLRDLATYEEAEIIRKKLESCLVGVVTSGDEGDNALGIPLAEANKPPGVYDSDGLLVDRFEPGMFAHVQGGKDIKFNTPAATGSYEAYKRASLHTIAAGFQVPHFLLSMDLSGVNYSSSKMGLEPFKRMIEAVQWLYLIPMLCQPMWEWFAEAAFLAGEIDSPEIPVTWHPPRSYSADPEKDSRADVIDVRAGLTAWPDAVAARGLDPEEQLRKIAEWNRKFDAAGVVLDTDPRLLSANGQTQQTGDGGEPSDGDSQGE